MAIFEVALDPGLDIGMVASFSNSIPTIEQEFRDLEAYSTGAEEPWRFGRCHRLDHFLSRDGVPKAIDPVKTRHA